MTDTKKLSVTAWLCSLTCLSGTFLPLLQFSFNDYKVNLFGICEEFDSRGLAMFDRFPPLGYATFAVMVIAAFCQILYLIKAAKKDASAKGTQRFSVIMTIFAIAALAGYLLLVFSRSDYTLTVVPFLVLIAGVTYIVLSGKIEKHRGNQQPTAPTSSTKPSPAAPTPSQKPQPVLESDANAVQKYMRLADKYAHIENLFAENQEKKDIEAQFLTGGIDAQEGIARFLTVCASGQMTQGWWNGAASLTGMIRKINKDNAENILLRLKNLKTNIWEYHTQVIDTAEKELLELKKENGGYPDGRIPAEFAHAELLNLQNVGSPEKRLEKFFAMQDSAPAWSDADKAFYYFIAGGAARVLYPVNKSNLAFYAAQVSCDPDPNSMGWRHLREAEGASLPATMESAKQMCEKYPLPKTMDEAKNYTYGFEEEKEPLKADPAAYTLDAGLNDLIALFRMYPQLNRAEIQAVGQKIYDADIPLVSGVGGMHQLYARFKERMPMYGTELSRIWDGIGDWAD